MPSRPRKPIGDDVLWKVTYSGQLKDVKSFSLSGCADGGQCARTDRSGGATRDVAAIGQIHTATIVPYHLRYQVPR
jgi:hypothetical protein